MSNLLNYYGALKIRVYRSSRSSLGASTYIQIGVVSPLPCLRCSGIQKETASENVGWAGSQLTSLKALHQTVAVTAIRLVGETDVSRNLKRTDRVTNRNEKEMISGISAVGTRRRKCLNLSTSRIRQSRSIL